MRSAHLTSQLSSTLLQLLQLWPLLLLLLLPMSGAQLPPLNGVPEVTGSSGQDYLGQFTFFRSWITKRRVFIVRATNAEVDRVLAEAIHGYRCHLAIRNVNLILLGDTKATETVFFHSEDNRRDFIQTRPININLRRSIGGHIRNLYRDLNRFRQWAILLGYDGGRKRMYLRVNFPALFEKIDGTAIRRREAMLQRKKSISCPRPPSTTLRP